jgi:hypothetical protein
MDWSSEGVEYLLSCITSVKGRKSTGEKDERDRFEREMTKANF